MRRRVVRWLWMVAVIALPGCGSKTAAPPAKPATTPVPAKAPVADTPAPAAKMPEAVVAKPEPKNDAASSSAVESPSKAADPPAEKPEEKPAEKIPARPERIVVLTPGGPLLIDVALSMDGKSHSDLFAARIQQVLDAADTDHNHQCTWSELAANEEFLKAERALNPNTPKRRTKAWSEQYDLNRDKQIQAKEAAAWLGRDAGRSVAAFSLWSRRAYYSVPSLASRVWQLLDIDNDGQLTAEELAAAPERFLSLDANDDRIITRAEMAPLREQLNDAGQPPPRLSRDADRYAALHLEPPGDIDRLEYLLADLYAPRQPLSPSSFPDLPHLFEQLDANKDGGLDQDELAKLLTVKPHLDLAVTFDKPAEGGNRGEARVEVRGHTPEVDVLAQPAPNRVVLSLSNTRIIISASDLAAVGPPEMAGERGALRVMVHDDFDALFETLDSNADGRLGEQETTTSPARMLTRDKNGDGQLTSGELPTAMIVAFLRSERPNEQSFYVPEDTATPRPTGTPLGWFAQADFNGDGAVSRREFLGSLEQFTRLDTNGDGFINTDEAAAAVTHENPPKPEPASTTPKDSPK